MQNEITGIPVPDVAISFSRQTAKTVISPSRTDSTGQFHVIVEDDSELDSLWSLRIEKELAGKQPLVLFDSLVTLRREMVISVGDLVPIHGKLSANEALVDSTIGVSVFGSSAIPPSWPHLIAQGFAATDGRFSFLGVLSKPTAELSLELSRNGEVIGIMRGAIASLASSGGSDLQLSLTHLRCRVIDDAGNPIPGAQIGIGPVDGRREKTPIARSSDADGQAEFTLLNGSDLELAVGKPGFSTSVQYLNASQSVEKLFLVLHRLDVDAAISGYVVHSDGTRAAGARVLVYVDTNLLLLSAITAAHAVADENGRFVVPFASASPATITASVAGSSLDGHVPIYEMEPQCIGPGKKAVTVVLSRHASLNLDISTVGDASKLRSAPSTFVMVNRTTHNVLSMELLSLPKRLLSIVPGEYDIFVDIASCDMAAQSAVIFRAGDVLNITVSAHKRLWIEGRVAYNGENVASGLTVIAHSTWPEEVAELFGTSVTDNNGHFRVQTSAEDAEVEIRNGSITLGRQKARVGERAELNLE